MKIKTNLKAGNNYCGGVVCAGDIADAYLQGREDCINSL